MYFKLILTSFTLKITPGKICIFFFAKVYSIRSSSLCFADSTKNGSIRNIILVFLTKSYLIIRTPLLEIIFCRYLIFFVDMKTINVNNGFQFIILVVITSHAVVSARNIDPGKLASS